MYYAGCIAELRQAIKQKDPDSVSAFSELKEGETAPLSYLLWMCEQVEKMDTSSVDEAVKAGRWMGWIFAHAELHKVWGNQKTRDLVRADRKSSFDKPHPF